MGLRNAVFVNAVFNLEQRQEREAGRNESPFGCAILMWLDGWLDARRQVRSSEGNVSALFPVGDGRRRWWRGYHSKLMDRNRHWPSGIWMPGLAKDSLTSGPARAVRPRTPPIRDIVEEQSGLIRVPIYCFSDTLELRAHSRADGVRTKKRHRWSGLSLRVVRHHACLLLQQRQGECATEARGLGRVDVVISKMKRLTGKAEK